MDRQADRKTQRDTHSHTRKTQRDTHSHTRKTQRHTHSHTRKTQRDTHSHTNVTRKECVFLVLMALTCVCNTVCVLFLARPIECATHTRGCDGQGNRGGAGVGVYLHRTKLREEKIKFKKIVPSVSLFVFLSSRKKREFICATSQ